MSIPLDLRVSFCLQPIELPVFNPVALGLLQMLEAPTTEIDDIVRAINEDQALSAQVLKMANSPAFSGLSRSETIKDSAVRLGTRQITNLAMAASQAAIHTSKNPAVFDVMQRLWLHSRSCALGCWLLAQKTGHTALADQAYMAGLLHDIGKLYILKALEQIHQTEPSIVLEQELIMCVFSEMHVELGCRLMDYWNIPPVYRAIAANHHAPQTDPHDILLAIVKLVNLNSRRLDLSMHPADPELDLLLQESPLRLTAETLNLLDEAMLGAGDSP